MANGAKRPWPQKIALQRESASCSILNIHTVRYIVPLSAIISIDKLIVATLALILCSLSPRFPVVNNTTKSLSPNRNPNRV